jgi:activator of HSP90 ATPase
MTTALSALGIAGTVFGVQGGGQTPPSSEGGEISRTAEAIHQEVVFKASRKRVYEVLTDAKQFDKIVKLSEAMKSGMPPDAKPTEIGKEAGGAFVLFGGHILGRHIELVPDERLVQAWRVVAWKPGVYSIVSFQLGDEGSGTKLVFDHAGFPIGQAQHLADGWKANYWKPMEKVLA